ncbi:MAG: tRNA uridine-5-carboxymethylaminomethyl(34) synthesis GTPase MnmE [Christensenellales bacterium]|jgi:tRNA modification GTPase
MAPDTIYALSTAPGRAGVAVVRISGDVSKKALEAVFRPYSKKDLEPRVMYTGELVLDNEVRDECMAVYFKSPSSYTGEDSAELHLHGSPVAVAAAYEALSQVGLRLAEPGEFTKRAFLNGKLDLSRAEAVMDFISASGELSAKAALRQMKGALSKEIALCSDNLLDISAEIEASIDFPEEDIEQQTLENVAARLRDVHNKLSHLISRAGMGEVLREGVKVVIAGRPNVGKSSLLNAILGRDRVIVTDIPGTTRDTLEECYVHKGLTIRFFDTAGIRRAQDEAEKLGIERALESAAEADITIFMLDGAKGITDEDRQAYLELSGGRNIIAVNKSDLEINVTDAEIKDAFSKTEAFLISAKLGQGVLALLDEIVAVFGREGVMSEDMISANRRQVLLLKAALGSVSDAIAAAEQGREPDIVSIDVREARLSLGLITGEAADEDVINRIFERFCLGK